MTEFDVRTLTGATVVDTGGDEIGKVGQVYLDDTSGQPSGSR
ncbi:MAG TPA: PRC-barrel domain-containing protein [Mycobacteriales bacterium]|jgi:sporulation protein YlmC with PRC-barrel domain|nr:PRC-barrel domain-containing protein [Mycobacteriales bacterium]